LHLGAVGDAEYPLEGEDGTVEPIRAGLVTPRSFQFLPAVPIIGRVFTAEDSAPGAEPTVLVRERLWRRRFGGSQSILGQSIQLSGLNRAVVGVLPDAFKFPSSGEIWLPLDEATLAGRAGVSGASELAVRTALGARRSRIVGQLFVDVAILSAIASVLGLGFAQVAINYVAGTIGDIPFWMTFDPTIRTMAFVVALALLVSVVSGLGPALKVTSVHLNGALHAHGRGSAAGGLGSVGRVLVVKVVLSVALLNCALLTARAVVYVDDIPALPKGQVLTSRLSLEESKETRDRLLACSQSASFHTLTSDATGRSRRDSGPGGRLRCGGGRRPGAGLGIKH
jgi:hypothetical protein